MLAAWRRRGGGELDEVGQAVEAGCRSGDAVGAAAEKRGLSARAGPWPLGGGRIEPD